MNRLLKFRAWYEDQKEMCYNDDQAHFDNEYWDGIEHSHIGMINRIFNDSVLKPDGVIFMQYTGLKDKAGKEIYEGDIILRTDEHATIFFNSSMAAFDFELPGGDCEPMVLADGWHPEVHTVIGNIYEHPHLIETVK